MNSEDRIVPMHIPVPERLRRAVKAKAAAEGRPMKEAVNDLLERWVNGKAEEQER